MSEPEPEVRRVVVVHGYDAAHNPPAPPGAGGPDGRGRMGARTGPVGRVPAAPAGRTAAAPVVTP